MKAYSILAVVAIMSILASCKKEQPHPCVKNTCNIPARKVRYELYTNENFKGETDNITFRLFMRDSIRTILDSSLATMKVEDIPDFSHRIIIEKLVPANNTSSLVVGFIYDIENVGESWHLEEFPSGETFKVVTYPFR